MKSDCPRHFWLRHVLLLVGSAPYLAGQETAFIRLTLSTCEQRQNAGWLLAEEPNLREQVRVWNETETRPSVLYPNLTSNHRAIF